MVAFRRALDENAGGIELDVHRCASGEMVVIHDATLKRTTNGNGRVARRTLSELRTLDTGNGEGVPALQEVLALVAGRIPVYIELKHTFSAIPILAELKQYVKSGGRLQDVMVITTLYRELEELAALDKRIPLGAGMPRGAIPTLKQLMARLPIQAIFPYHDRVDAAFVEVAHAAQVQVYPWTVNQVAEAKRLQACGVDGIITDVPGVMQKL